MKKRVFLLAVLMVLVLCGCGSSSSNSVTNGSQTSQEELNEQALNELNQMIQEEEEAREAEQEAIQNQAEQQNEYIEGIIPAGRYYRDGDTSKQYLTFAIDEEGNGIYGQNEHPTDGTYTYDPETGMYFIDYTFRVTIEEARHVLYEGYYREEDFCFVMTKSSRIIDEVEYLVSDEETEYIRIVE